MTDFFSTNSFDLAVYACLFVAVVMGFMTGLLRSLATIIGYICGAGIAVAATPKALSLLANYPKIPTPQTWIVVVAIFIVTGALISALLRLTVSGIAGRNITVPDRIAGAALGAVRFAMLAIMLVLVFDRMIPPGREPAFPEGLAVAARAVICSTVRNTVASTGSRRLYRSAASANAGCEQLGSSAPHALLRSARL
jgi:membrane protein required for colicin V production